MLWEFKEKDTSEVTGLEVRESVSCLIGFRDARTLGALKRTLAVLPSPAQGPSLLRLKGEQRKLKSASLCGHRAS